MKSLLSFAFALVATLALSACTNDQKEIEETAMGYLDALGNYRVSDARPFSTPQTCDVTLSFFEAMMANTDPTVYANNIPATITIGEITMNDDSTATVAFHKSTPSVEQDGTITVIKMDGKWLVDQVLDINPMMMQMARAGENPKPRTFSDEEINEMRKNK